MSVHSVSLRDACDRLLSHLVLERVSEEVVSTLLERARERALGQARKLDCDVDVAVVRCFVDLLATEQLQRIESALANVDSTRQSALALAIAENAKPDAECAGLDPSLWQLGLLRDEDESYVALLSMVKWMRAQEKGLEQGAEVLQVERKHKTRGVN